MEQHKIPEKPWRKIGADLFTLFGKNFLVVVDYTSNYPEVAKLEDLSSTNTISHMKSIMARHGLPSVVVSDNGPQFSSREFRQFAMQYGFKHVTSSPEYPHSNGKAKKAVQIYREVFVEKSGKGPISWRDLNEQETENEAAQRRRTCHHAQVARHQTEALL